MRKDVSCCIVHVFLLLFYLVCVTHFVQKILIYFPVTQTIFLRRKFSFSLREIINVIRYALPHPVNKRFHKGKGKLYLRYTLVTQINALMKYLHSVT